VQAAEASLVVECLTALFWVSLYAWISFAAGPIHSTDLTALQVLLQKTAQTLKAPPLEAPQAARFR